jgi:hypothetical protein
LKAGGKKGTEKEARTERGCAQTAQRTTLGNVQMDKGGHLPSNSSCVEPRKPSVEPGVNVNLFL